MTLSEEFPNQNSIREIEEGLAQGEITPKDRLQNQIRLATEVFKLLKDFKSIETEEDRNEIMNFWVDSGLSSLYRELENSEEFQNHPRLKGDIYKITAQDILDFKEKGSLAA